MLFFTDSNLVIKDPSLSLSNWSFGEVSATAGYRKITLDAHNGEKHRAYHPEVLFEIEFSPIGVKNIIIIFLPIIFLVLLLLFAFLTPYRNIEDSEMVRSLAMGSVATLIGHRFVIQGLIPNVAYLTATDLLFAVALLTSFVPALFYIILT